MSENAENKNIAPSEQEPPKEKTAIPSLENYIHPIDIEELQNLQEHIELVLKNYDKKLEQTKGNNILLKKKEVVVKLPEIASLFKEKESLSEIQENDKYDAIFDCLNFYHFTNDKSQEVVKGSVDQSILDKLYNKHLNEKGVLLILSDYQYLCQLCENFKKILGEKYMTKIFIKFYIISKLPFVGVFSVQKMFQAKEPVNPENEKLLSYELNKIDDKYCFSKPISYTFGQLAKSITYIYQMYQYQAYLYKLHPGTITPIKIKETLWGDNIDFTISVVDSADEELLKLKKCAAIIISKNFANEFISLTAEGNMGLCKQCQVSRLLLIRAAPFNFDSINVIKEKISNYIILFKFSTCVDQSIPIMLMNEENKEVQDVFMNDSILIRDVREKDLTLRQLIFRSNPYQIQCEIKTMLCSKTKIKNEKENYIPIKTLEKFTKKNLVQCFDDSFIAMFYIQALLTGIFFIDLYNFPQEKVKILVLGAGIGTINYYFDKILNSNVLIDAVELDKNVAEMGMEYFGLNNYKKEKNPDIKWHFKDAKEFIKEKNVSDYYDLIVMDINNTNSIEGISPPPVFFEQDVIDKIFTMLKPNGIYIIDLLARSYQGYKKVFNIIDSKFPHILYVDNNEDLNKIHFCFKNKRTKTENLQLYADGLKKLSNPEVGNIKDIESSANIFITKFVEASNQKEILDAYTS
jgi:hypothetical protein